MKILSKRIHRIELENLLIDLQNPRYDPRTSQREALATIANDQGIKLVNLADDIIDKGLNPSELPVVMETDEANRYIVLEGNRRIAALKLVSSLSLLTSLGLPQALTKQYKNLCVGADLSLLKEIDCVVLSREDANHWILIKHTGENEGVGVLGWDGRARHRFRGSSPALQAVELVETSQYLDEETKRKLPKIAITNIERILGTPDARKHLGVDVKNNQLTLKSPEDEALGRLALVVGDVARRQVKVTDLDTREQRIEYAKEVAARPIPKKALPKGRDGSTTSSGPSSKSGRRISPDRRTLIPKQLKLTISQTRVNRIYHELQKLSVDQFVNSCAVLLRVFVEMSIDDFAQRRGIQLQVPVRSKPGASAPSQFRDMSLREKVNAVAEHLEKHGLCSKAELRGVRALVANRDHVLSVDSWNAYVHNRDYNPTPVDLKGNWDNIQVFVERIWAV